MMMRVVLLLLWTTIRVSSQPFTVVAPCSLAQRRLNFPGCLTFMRGAVQDPNIFWYGSSLRRKCEGNSNERNLTCSNILPDGAAAFSYATLGSRVFQQPDFNASITLAGIQSDITVTYDSPPEAYYGCNSTLLSGQRIVFDANPNMIPMPAFFFRKAPTVSVGSCTFQSLCTLILYDGSLGIVHNIWPNWPRDDPFLTKYANPGPARAASANTYVWLAYSQNGAEFNYTQPMGLGRWSINVTDFAAQNSLTGPIGITWMLVMADIFSVQYLESLSIGGKELCAPLLEEKLQTQNPLLLGDLDQSVSYETIQYWVAVRFPTPRTLPGLSIDSGAGAWLDPLNNRLISGVYTQNAPEIYLVPRLLSPNSDDLTGKFFTIAMARRDDTAASVVKGGIRVFLYWLLTDIPNGDISSGNTSIPYAGCTTIPNFSANQNYYILLYEQPGSPLTKPSSDYYTADCGNTASSNRCQFPLSTFVRENQLNFVGLSRFQVAGSLRYFYGFPG